MPTDSLFTPVIITDPETAERFVKALEESAEELKTLPPCNEGAKPIMTDLEEIKKLLSKRFPILEESAEEHKTTSPCNEGAKPIMTDPEKIKKFLSRRFPIKE